jgi:hypothetical protein
MDSPEALDLLLSVFDQLGIAYMIGGSLASSMAGVWRATQDIDIVAPVGLDQTASLEEALIRDFYADAATMRDAIGRARPFNVIHYASSQKFDIFPVLDDPYYKVEFAAAADRTPPAGWPHFQHPHRDTRRHHPREAGLVPGRRRGLRAATARYSRRSIDTSGAIGSRLPARLGGASRLRRSFGRSPLNACACM